MRNTAELSLAAAESKRPPLQSGCSNTLRQHHLRFYPCARASGCCGLDLCVVRKISLTFHLKTPFCACRVGVVALEFCVLMNQPVNN